MDYNNIFTVILFVFFTTGCNDVNHDEDIEIIRFEKQFYNSDENQLDDLILKHPYLFPSQFSKSTWVNKINDSIERIMYNKSTVLFEDYDFNSLKIKSIFNNAKNVLNFFKTPKIYTLINKGDFIDRMIYNDPYLFISLNLYFGSNYYENIPDYISKKMDKFFIPNDIAFRISESYIKDNNDDRTLLSNMVLYGKIIYLNKLLNIEEEDWVIFNTSIEKMKWTNENEFDIWNYFVKNEYFFDTDIGLRSRFMSLAPYSKFNLDIDKKSPGSIGRWLGYKIVDSYMKNNKTNLNELVDLDHYTIFRKSKYKPSK